MNRLFVYGIFLDQSMRSRYAMSNPRYATVLNYATWGGDIVTAYRQEGAGLALTGLIVTVAPFSMGRNGMIDNWKALDILEGGYERVEIKTVQGDRAYMYVGKEYNEQKSSDTASSQKSEKQPV